jgi:Tol biopolymer transport system component
VLQLLRSLTSRTIALSVAGLVALAVPSAASADGYSDPLDLEMRWLNTSFGIQTDPHVDAGLVSYTNEEPSSEIRVYDLAAGTDAAVPKTRSDFDFLSDTNGGRVVLTRVTSDRSAIFLVDPAAGGSPTELDPTPGSRRRGAVIGGDTVAWQDLGDGTAAGAAEIVVYDSSSGTSTHLTDDHLLDRMAAVSPDGNVIVWSKCRIDGLDCDIWRALRLDGGWSTARVTEADGEHLHPDTDGTWITYGSTRNGERDIYAQPVAGGAERRLDLEHPQAHPNIDGGVVSFETYDATATSPNWDLAAWDLASGRAYRLTQTAHDETLSDISEDEPRRFTVPFSASDDIGVITFRLPDDRDADRPVTDRIGELIERVNGMSTDGGTNRSLTAKLVNALRQVTQDNPRAACGMLTSFIREVSAQAGKRIPSPDAERLIADAKEIEAALGC